MIPGLQWSASSIPCFCFYDVLLQFYFPLIIAKSTTIPAHYSFLSSSLKDKRLSYTDFLIFSVTCQFCNSVVSILISGKMNKLQYNQHCSQHCWLQISWKLEWTNSPAEVSSRLFLHCFPKLSLQEKLYKVLFCLFLKPKTKDLGSEVN